MVFFFLSFLLSLLLGEVENDLFLIVGVEEGFSLKQAIMRAMLWLSWLGLVNFH